jgi:hypothetical protein
VKLKTETNTPAMGKRIAEAFKASQAAESHICSQNVFSSEFEHGQWWVLCLCGESWSVVDAESGTAVDGFDFEPL